MVGGEMGLFGARPTWARRATSSSGTDRDRYRDDTNPLAAEATWQAPLPQLIDGSAPRDPRVGRPETPM
jgi:hypothetical protein